MNWDWTLKVWGPKSLELLKGKAFTLDVFGVVMNNPAKAGKF